MHTNIISQSNLHRRRLLLGLLLGTAAVLVETWRRRRNYLTRPSLMLPIRSAAAHLLRARNDKAYICAFGLDVSGFEALHHRFMPHLASLPQRKAKTRLLSSRMQLALVLYFLTSPQRQKSIAITFGLVPAATSEYIWNGLRCMREMMRHDKAYWRIKWPSADVMANMAAAVKVREPLLDGVFGFVDGLNLRTYEPGDTDEQNAYYSGWLGHTCCGQVLVFLANGEIAWVCFNAPGSWHDSKIAAPLYKLLSDPVRTPGAYRILADSAFPRGMVVNDKILSKPKENIVMDEDDVGKLRLWAAVTRQRQAAEWGMRALQGAFGRLDLRLPVDKRRRHLLLYVVFHLHNFRTRLVGLNQIKETYFPQWSSRSSQ